MNRNAAERLRSDCGAIAVREVEVLLELCRAPKWFPDDLVGRLNSATPALIVGMDTSVADVEHHDVGA